MTDLSASFDNWYNKLDNDYRAKNDELIELEKKLEEAKTTGEGVLLAGAAVSKARRERDYFDQRMTVGTLIKILKDESPGGKIAISIPEWDGLILQFSWGNYKASKEIGLDQPERISVNADPVV